MLNLYKLIIYIKTMFNPKKPTIGDFAKDQNFSIEDGKLKKVEPLTPEEIDKKAEEDLEKMKKDPNYDPSTGKSYFGEDQYHDFGNKGRFEDGEPYEIEDDEEYRIEQIEVDIESYANEDSLYQHFKREMDNKEDNDIDYDDAMGKLEEKIIRFKTERKQLLESTPKYTDFEKESLKAVVAKHLRGREQKIGEKQLSKKQVEEALEEFKQNFPADFTKMIHNKVIDNDLKWKKETFDGKKLLVSYYPSIEEPIIKYIMNDEPRSKDSTNKLFVNTSMKKNGNNYRNKDGSFLVFCSQIKRKKKRN